MGCWHRSGNGLLSQRMPCFVKFCSFDLEGIRIVGGRGFSYVGRCLRAACCDVCGRVGYGGDDSCLRNLLVLFAEGLRPSRSRRGTAVPARSAPLFRSRGRACVWVFLCLMVCVCLRVFNESLSVNACVLVSRVR